MNRDTGLPIFTYYLLSLTFLVLDLRSQGWPHFPPDKLKQLWDTAQVRSGKLQPSSRVHAGERLRRA
jgi:hypothetical protein